MEKLNISTGIKEYSLNDKVSVWFNPTDADFMTRVFDTFDALEKKQDEYANAIAKTKTTRESLKVMADMNEEMRGLLLELFGTDIVTPLIGNANVYAFSEGMPIWANIMLAILDKMEGEHAEQIKLSKKRMAKYTAKYADHKKKAKK